MEIPSSAKTVLLLAFGVNLGATVAFFIASVGLAAIALLWLALGVVFLVVLVYVWRSRLASELDRSRMPVNEIGGDGVALVDVLAVWKTKDGKRHKRVIKRGQRMPRLGEGELKDAVEGWHEPIKRRRFR